MQVEGFTYPGSGQLTTSLIAPITVASPPKSPSKYVLLGSEQRGNGNVRYRVGLLTNPEGDQNLRELSNYIGATLANGKVPVIPQNEHIHVFGVSRDTDNNRFAFHFVIEDTPDGQIAADIAAMSGDLPVGHLSGLATLANYPGDSHNTSPPLTSLSSQRDNVINLQTYDGRNIFVNLGKVEQLIVECGMVERFGSDYQTRRDGGRLRIFSRDEAALKDDPFGHYPIATLEPCDVTTLFSHSLAPVNLRPEVAAGHVLPAPVASNSGRTL